MFPTTTAPDKTELAGPAYLRRYRDEVPLPHLAIGGITPDNVGELVAAGVRGVAVSSAVCGARQPGDTVRKLLAALPTAIAPKNETADTRG